MGVRKRTWFIGASAVAGLILVSLVIFWRTGGSEVSASTPSAQGPSANIPTAIQPLTGPWVVALQPGHWEIRDLPQELWRLRNNTGAQWGSIHEVDINRAVVNALVPLLQEKGWKVEVVPATVPPELRVDAFIAVHADSTTDTTRRGWKLAPPWRASQASRELANDLAASFAAEPNLVEDRNDITVNMRGYYAFNDRRFVHAISPYTPAVIIELGFLSNATDRSLLTSNPGFWAGIIARGLTTYFNGRDRSKVSDLQPLQLAWMAAGPEGAVVRFEPRADAERKATLEAGTVIMPVDVSGDWYEVFMRHPFSTGWVLKSALVPAENPRWPMPGERGRPAATVNPPEVR